LANKRKKKEKKKKKKKKKKRNLNAPQVAASGALKSQFEHVLGSYGALLSSDGGASEEESLRIQAKLQAVVPPPLPEAAASTLLDMAAQLLELDSLRQASLELVRCISLSNADLVLERIRRDLQKSAVLDRKDDVLPCVLLLQSTSMRINQLEDMLRSIADCSSNFKKPAQWHSLSESIYLCVWKWIENFTTEFLALWQDKLQFDSHVVLRLFDLLEGWSKVAVKVFVVVVVVVPIFRLIFFFLFFQKKGQPGKIWPAQTLLLMLCPSVVVSIAQDKVPRN
jgi:hypothetical protein